MVEIKKILEKTGLKVFRLVCQSKEKPQQYITFQRIAREPEVSSDDQVNEEIETWRISLFSKVDFEEKLSALVTILRQEGIYVQAIDTELYENETGYYLVPITIQIIRSENI